MIISYGTQTIEFQIQRNSKIKNTYITVARDIGVIIKAPESINHEEIKNLVKAKAFWINSKLEELGKVIDYGEITTGSRIFYLGKSYYVSLIIEKRQDIKIVFIHSKFKIYAPNKVNQRELNNAIDKFYQQKAQKKITKLVKKYSDIMQLHPKKIEFKKSKIKWASCSEGNRLSFNPELIKLSSSLIEYTIVHELAHIAYKNHSKDFWRLVKKYMSDYSIKNEKLRIFEKKL
jgi:predicted metal-dependent hydrolase